jgi:DNA-binding transcriptional ArsR family regulator
LPSPHPYLEHLDRPCYVRYNIDVYGSVHRCNMMNDRKLEREGHRALQRYFAESGIRLRSAKEQRLRDGRGPDAELEIQLPSGDRRHLIVEFKANSRRAPVEAALAQLRNQVAHSASSKALPLLFSGHLGRPMREWLKSQGVWFADLSGNRFFWGPGLFVDREVAERPDQMREPAPSVFADRNSLVLRYLLPRPPAQIGIRELARKLELSPAAVSLSLRRLREMGHLERGSEIRLLDREALLGEWVSFYRPRFRRQAEFRYYLHVKSAEAIIRLLRAQRIAKEDGYGLSLHAGASLVAPFVQFREVHVYVPEAEDALRKRLLKALGGKEAIGEANLVFLNPFYRSSFLFGARVIRGVRVVSDLQLYLDLSCFPQRGAEQAEVILERRLRPSWSGR